MSKLRVLLAAVLILLAVVVARVTPVEAQDGTITKIADGVWFRQGEWDETICSNVVIEMKDYLVVVDANFPAGAKRLMADVEKISSKPVRWVFVTHHHSDHLYGNPLWTSAGATTISHANVLAEIDRYEPASWQRYAKQRPGVAELNLDGPEPPQKTFTDNPYVITDGERRIELYHFGWAHTRGDAFAYLPAEKILCSGDAILNGPYNYLAQGNVHNWPSVLDQVAKLAVERVLPGHGAPGGPELITGQKQFLVELYQGVKAAVDRGEKLEDIVTIEDGNAVATSIKLSGEVSNWVADGLPGQVRDTYRQIVEGLE
jgi:cyclase